LVANTENVYEIPFVRSEHAAVTPDTTHDPPDGTDETEYDVTGAPPSSAGADHDTVAEAFPATAATAVGSEGVTA